MTKPIQQSSGVFLSFLQDDSATKNTLVELRWYIDDVGGHAEVT